MIGGRRRFGKAGGTVKVVDPYVGPNVLISDVRSPEVRARILRESGYGWSSPVAGLA